MLKKPMKTVVVTAAVMALGSTGAAALGDGKASLNAYVYDVTSAWTTMYLSSSDGAKWDTIEDGTLKFFAHMKIDTKWPGEVSFVGIVLGKCPVESCHVLPILWSKQVSARDYNDQGNISVPTSLLTGRRSSIPATSTVQHLARRIGMNFSTACRRRSLPIPQKRGGK